APWPPRERRHPRRASPSPPPKPPTPCARAPSAARRPRSHRPLPLPRERASSRTSLRGRNQRDRGPIRILEILRGERGEIARLQPVHLVEFVIEKFGIAGERRVHRVGHRHRI